ncbi:DUF6287 domain-containing protein [Granulicatella sp.]
MKKTHLLVGLGISISLLTACQNSSSGSNSATTEAETTTQTTVAPKPVTDYTLYNSVLEDYKEVIEAKLNNREPHSPKKETDGLSYLAYVATRGMGFSGIAYTLYDFDHNGIDELVIAYNTSKDSYDIIDIRSIVDGKVVRLTNKNNGLQFIGNSFFLHPLEDGSFITEQVNTAPSQLHFNDKKSDLEVVEKELTNEQIKNLSPKVTFSKDVWKPTQWYITSPEKQKEVAKKKIDIQAIQNGDYSSLKGTWVDGTGHTFTFDEKGLVDENYEMKLSYFKEYKGTLIGGYGPKNSPVGGAAVYIIPGGVPMSDDRSGTFVDPIKTDKDRIFAGQQFPRFADEFHYRIDD